MNSLILAAIALAFFIVAWRYLGRFLAALHAEPEAHYSTAMPGVAEGGRGLLAAVSHSGLPLALVGALLLAPAPAGAAFVWALLAAVLVAGPYLSTPLSVPGAVVAPLLALFSVMAGAWALTLLATLLAHHPAVATAFVLQLGVMELFRDRGRSPPVLAALTVALVLAVALGHALPLALAGHIRLQIAHHVWRLTPAVLVALPLAVEVHARRAGHPFSEQVTAAQWALFALLVVGALLWRPATLPLAPAAPGVNPFWLLGGLPLLALPAARPPHLQPAGRFAWGLILGFLTLSIFLLAAGHPLPGHTVLTRALALPQLLVPRSSWLGTWVGTTWALGLRALLLTQLRFQQNWAPVAARPSLKPAPLALTLVAAAVFASFPQHAWTWTGAFNFLLLGLTLWFAGQRLRVLRLAGILLLLLAVFGLLEPQGTRLASMVTLAVAAALGLLGRPWSDPEQA